MTSRMTHTRSAREPSVAPRQAVIATTITEPVQNVGDVPDSEILYHPEPTGLLPLSRPISPTEELRLLRNENNHLYRQLEQGMYHSPTAELAQPPQLSPCKEAKVLEPPEFTGRVLEHRISSCSVKLYSISMNLPSWMMRLRFYILLDVLEKQHRIGPHLLAWMKPTCSDMITRYSEPNSRLSSKTQPPRLTQ